MLNSTAPKTPERYFIKYLNHLRSNGLLPKIHEISGPSTNPTITIDGKEFLTFCSNNYLGLAQNLDVIHQTKKAIDLYGTGSGSTRLLSGTLDIQAEFESALAKYFGYEGSITFSSGYLANAGVIRMLVDPFPYFKIPSITELFSSDEGVIISDELNHASIFDGIRLSNARREVFSHNNMEDLETRLKQHKRKRKLIITDGVFSMDGDIANLNRITELAKQYESLLFVDDSHAVGVLGPQGRGVAALLGVEKDVDVLMGSFTKAFGSIGGFVTANRILTDYLRITARSYIFSDPIPPAIVSGLLTTLNIIENGNDLRLKVANNANHLRIGLKKAGFTVLGNGTPIVPLLIKDEIKAIKFAEELATRRILAPCIRNPAVIPGMERIRFSVMASHKESDVEQLLGACREIGKSLGLI